MLPFSLSRSRNDARRGPLCRASAEGFGRCRRGQLRRILLRLEVESSSLISTFVAK